MARRYIVPVTESGAEPHLNDHAIFDADLARLIHPDDLPNALDNGVKGDGNTDDTAKLSTFLNRFMNRGEMVMVPPTEAGYFMGSGLTISYTQQTFQRHGIFAYGAELRPDFDDEPVIEIQLNFAGDVKGFSLLGLSFEPADELRPTHGIYCAVPQSDRWMANWVMRDLFVRAMQTGIELRGGLFESLLDNCFVRSCTDNGITLGNIIGQGGIMTSVDVRSCNLSFNGGYGLQLVDNLWWVTVDGGYCLCNGEAGIQSSNGILGINRMGFEDNSMNAASFAAGGPAVQVHNFCNMRDCYAYTGAGFKQKGLFAGFLNGGLIMDGCAAGAADMYLASLTGHGRRVIFKNVEPGADDNYIDAVISDHGYFKVNDQLTSYVKTALPDATEFNNARDMIYVSNTAGGAQPCFSDGTNWREVVTRAVVS